MTGGSWGSLSRILSRDVERKTQLVMGGRRMPGLSERRVAASCWHERLLCMEAAQHRR